MVPWSNGSNKRRCEKKEPVFGETPAKVGYRGLEFLRNPLAFLFGNSSQENQENSLEIEEVVEVIVGEEETRSLGGNEEIQCILQRSFEKQDDAVVEVHETPKRRTKQTENDEDDLQVIKVIHSANRTVKTIDPRLLQDEILRTAEKDEDESDAGSGFSFLDNIADTLSPQPEDSASRTASPAGTNRFKEVRGRRELKDKFARRPTPKIFDKKVIAKPAARCIKPKLYPENLLKARNAYCQLLSDSGLPESPLRLNKSQLVKAQRRINQDYLERAKKLIASTSDRNSKASSVISLQSSSSNEHRTSTSSMNSSSGGSMSEKMANLMSKLKEVNLTTPTVKSRLDRILDDRAAVQRKAGGLNEEVRVRTNVRQWAQQDVTEAKKNQLEAQGLRFKPVPKPKKIVDDFPELPEEALPIIKSAWDRSLPSEEILTKNQNVEITRKDLYTLHGLNWLNDEVINTYLQLVCARSEGNENLPRTYAFNTFFYKNISTKGYAFVRRWTKKVDIFSYDIILVPVHLEVHWCMAVIDLAAKKIEYYDSMLGNNQKCLDNLRNYLNDESKDKKKVPFNFEGWQFVARRDIPTQENHSDCGVFSCQFGEWAARRREITFDQSKMPYFRRKMVFEIIKQKLLV